MTPCPICKKKLKNVLLHVEKSEKCTTKISLEEKEQLKERSDQIRRDRNRIAMVNTIIIKLSKHKQLPGASRSGRNQ